MPRTTPDLDSALTELLAGIGARLKRARLRRGLSASFVADASGMVRNTLARVERGDGAVSMEIYARVMEVLGVEGDLQDIAHNDPMQEWAQLPLRKRAPKTPRH